MKKLLADALVKARALSFFMVAFGRSARALTIAATMIAAASAQQITVAPPAGVLGKGAETLYGPVVATAVEIPGEKPKIVTRGIFVRGMDAKKPWGLCFDADGLIIAASWENPVLDLKKTNLATYKGLTNGAAVVGGKTLLRSDDNSGWRGKPKLFYGYYLHGTDVVFSYRIQNCDVLDSPTIVSTPGGPMCIRRVTVGPCNEQFQIEQNNDEAHVTNGLTSISGLESAGDVEMVKLQVTSSDTAFSGIIRKRTVSSASQRFESRIIGPSTIDGVVNPGTGCESAIFFGMRLPLDDRKLAEPKPIVTLADFRNAGVVLNEIPDLREWTKGGPANWPQTITVAGKRAPDDAAYVVDTIPLPDDNPWKCWLRPTGIDFFPDGRLAICTLGGDVWIASGIDDSLAKVTWRRFAGGLREPMGLRIVDGKILVGCRDQITRLHDLNDNGEADFYECVNMGRTLIANFHAFAYDLQTDKAGNFYYGTGGNQLGPDQPWHGQLWRVSSDGKKLDAYAKGLRAPNGLTISPDGAIYVSDNQGNWIASSKISRIREGGFYGYIADPKFTEAKVPPTFDPPVCYIPHTWDNSSGGGTFCESEKWGPFRGRMLHTSFGAAALFAVFEQRMGDVSNGAVVKFPLAFESGIHRARFGTDGQLYVVGTKGWQSKAIRDGCLARVRYTGKSSGKPITIPTNWRVEKDALIIEFAAPLDRSSAEDTENFAAQQWNYKWHATYGSPDISVAEPKRTGRDSLEIQSSFLSNDGKTVTLRLPGLGPIMQILVKANLKFADGTPLPMEVVGTINRIP